MPVYGGRPGALPPMDDDARQGSAPAGTDAAALNSITKSDSDYATVVNMQDSK